MSKKLFFFILSVLLIAISTIIFIMLKQTEINNSKENKLKQYVTQRTIKEEKQNCSKDNKEVNIALITDSRYTLPTGTVMYSAIKNKCPSSIYNFYIITENTTPFDDAYLKRMKNLAPDSVNVTIIPRTEPDLPYENMQRFLQYKVGMHKIYLPEILKDIEKVIYMDGDVIVLKDLSNLFNIDISNEYASVVKDGIYYRFFKEMKEMGLDKRGFYFNSGVMLYNLKKQRQDQIVDKLVEYVKTHNDFYGDQDVLNVVFGDKLKLMSYKNNCISTFFEADDLNFLSTYFGELLPKDTFYIYQGATVIHYAGDKPWHDNYSPEYLKELWFRYYNQAKDI